MKVHVVVTKKWVTSTITTVEIPDTTDKGDNVAVCEAVQKVFAENREVQLYAYLQSSDEAEEIGTEVEVFEPSADATDEDEDVEGQNRIGEWSE